MGEDDGPRILGGAPTLGDYEQSMDPLDQQVYLGLLDPAPDRPEIPRREDEAFETYDERDRRDSITDQLFDAYSRVASLPWSKRFDYLGLAASLSFGAMIGFERDLFHEAPTLSDGIVAVVSTCAPPILSTLSIFLSPEGPSYLRDILEIRFVGYLRSHTLRNVFSLVSASFLLQGEIDLSATFGALAITSETRKREELSGIEETVETSSPCYPPDQDHHACYSEASEASYLQPRS